MDRSLERFLDRRDQRKSSAVTWPYPLPQWPLSEPPADVEFHLNSDGDLALTRAQDFTWLAWSPEPAPYTLRTFPGPGPTTREEWDSVRLSWAENRVVAALGGSAHDVWATAHLDRAREWVRMGDDPGPPLVPVWMDQALPDWVRRRRLEEY